MSLRMEVRVGKRYAIYLPRAVVEVLGLREGERVLLRVSGGSLILEPVRDPIQLALFGGKFASITPEEVEEISLEEQRGYLKGSP